MITVKVLSELEQMSKDYALDALAEDVEPGQDPAFKYGKAQGFIKGIRAAMDHIAQILEQEEKNDV